MDDPICSSQFLNLFSFEKTRSIAFLLSFIGFNSANISHEIIHKYFQNLYWVLFCNFWLQVFNGEDTIQPYMIQKRGHSICCTFLTELQ